MIIETKYDLNDTVYCIDKDWRQKNVPCKICDSTGKVEIKGKQWVCPNCGGEKLEETERFYTVVGPGKITRIGTEVDVEQKGTFICYHILVDGISRMAGGSWVFDCEKLAWKEADRLNSKPIDVEDFEWEIGGKGER